MTVRLLFESSGGDTISSIINILLMAAVLMFVYYNMFNKADSGLVNVFIFAAVSVGVLLAAVRMFLARRRKK